jgi:hypothetical protein
VAVVAQSLTIAFIVGASVPQRNAVIDLSCGDGSPFALASNAQRILLQVPAPDALKLATSYP